MFKNIPHNADFETYFNKTLSILCQQGVLFRGAETIKNTCVSMNLDIEVSQQDLCSTVNLLTRNNGIIIQENTQLMQVAPKNPATSILNDTHVDPTSGMTVLTNPDNSSMLNVTCQTHVKFHYHDEQVKSLFDKRSVLIKTSDFVNSFFHQNGLTPLDKASDTHKHTFH